MANTVKLTIKVDDDGSLNVVAKEAKAAAAATDKLGTSTDKLSNKKNRFNKLEKGTAQLGANSTKSFSKQAQTIGGGLVPAYAVLAANVFALTAAFQFLKNAADVSILEQSQVDFARNTGVALQSVTSRLREASDGMLGFSEAGQAAAIGLAKGFSPKQLEDLAEGARKASTALGRDFADSFDRLVRGASKAEPELLDELGITLRLEDATRKYADAIKVNRKELTASQRSQAVLIETQTQLNDLFGAVEAKTNPFIKLAKTLEDLVKTATQAVLPVFEGIASIINRSGTAAVAAFGLLALNILKAAIPMETISQKVEDFAQGHADAAKRASADQVKFREELAKTKKAQAEVAVGAAQKGAKGLMGQNKKLGGSALLGKVASGVALSPAQKGQLNKILKDAEFSYKRHGKITTGMFKGVNIEIVRGFATSFSQIDARAMTTGQRMKVAFKSATLQANVLATTLKTKVAGAFVVVGKAAGVMGGAISKALSFAGFIGVLLMIKELFMAIFNSPYTILLNSAKLVDGILSVMAKAFNATARGILGVVESISTGVLSLFGMLKDGINFVVRGYMTALDGIINGVIKGINSVINVVNILGGEGTMDAFDYKSTLQDSIVLFEDTSSGVVKLTDDFVGMSETVNLATSAVENNMGALKRFEEGNAAVIRSKEALEGYSAAAGKMKADMEGIAAGINAQADSAKKGMAVAKAVGTLGVSGQAGKIRSDFIVPDSASESQKAKILENQAEAMNKLRDSVAGAGKISKLYEAAINKALSPDATQEDIANLTKLEIAARAATSGAKDLAEGISGIGSKIASNLGGGDAEKAIQNLKALEANAKQTAGGLQTLEQFDAATERLAEFENALGLANMTTTQFRNELISLSAQQQALAVSQELANFHTGSFAQSLKLSNEQTGLALQMEANRLALLTELDPIEAKKLTRMQETLRIQLLLNSAKQGEAQAQVLSDNMGGSASLVGSAKGDTARAGLQIAVEAAEAQYAGLMGAFVMGDATLAELKIAETALATAKSDQIKGSILQASEALKNLGEDFKALGPEGAVMGSMATGIGSMAESFTTAFEIIGDKGKSAGSKIMAGMAAANSMIQAIGGTQKAASDARVKALDGEITAEKKRDGKSKESLAKIAQLEKKKEAEKKKAFEIDKKMKMAQTVMATATGAIEAYKAMVGIPIVGPALAAVAAAAVVAMGAKQLSTIASSSYNGGGSIGAAGGGGGQAGKISMGSRNNTADLATSRGARGELAYARGADGTGGMDSFKAAFSGYKNRAEGGNTGFVVGEQGPELFVPEMPGRIVPNDDIAAGGVSNVSFNINTVDASGVEDLLVAQRGNIIGMIRQAANTYGQDFVEEVDTSTFTQSAGGVSRY